jgi:uncharacterized membrane protein
VVDLHPSGYTNSQALATDGAQQVGWARTSSGVDHALLWTGNAASAIDINPTGYRDSRANGVNGGRQIGYTRISGDYEHAVVWNGSADDFIDLNPPGYDGSVGNGIFGSQQVGWASGEVTNFRAHAVVWNGTADSYVDLHPPGFYDSQAMATNGIQQVGSGQLDEDSLPGHPHALLWSGSADSYIDLQQYLPSDVKYSYATGIDADGSIVGYAVGGFQETYFIHAFLWVPVPEPATVSLLAVGGVLLFRRRAA